MDADIESIITAAMNKLERIIAREGDADGERRQTWYIAQLIGEQAAAAAITSDMLARASERPGA